MSILLTLISAVLYAFAFPKFHFALTAFFFLIPLLYLIDKKTDKSFLVFFSFAFTSNIIILYWIADVMVKYGGTSLLLGILALIFLSAFLAVFTGFAGILIKKSLSKQITLLLIPAIWISKDIILEYIFNGFPWCFVGYSQHKNLFFIQIAELGGIYFISFIILFINLLFYFYFIKKKQIYLIVIFSTFLTIYGSGYWLIKSLHRDINEIKYSKCGVIQPNAKNETYSEGEKNIFKKSNDEILQNLFTTSKGLSDRDAQFIIWPEYTLSIYPLQNKHYLSKFYKFAKNNVSIIAGFTDFKNSDEIYNSAILFKKGSIDKYDKVHLVPFGEYVLFKDLLFFIEKITKQIGEFTPGKNIKNIQYDNHLISTPICYEIIFPTLVRNFISKGGELLITLSNDSWYGTSAAPYQLLAMAIFRSIENRRYNIRATSNGISALISPTGEIIKKIDLNKKDTFIAKFKYINKKTIFTKFGYLFPLLNLVFVILLFLIPKLRNKKTENNFD